MARYQEDPIEVIAATFTAGSAPIAATAGRICNAPSGIIRTLVTYASTVTAAVLRLYTRSTPGVGEWFKCASTTDRDALAPFTDGHEARDWFVGQGIEYLFVLESVSPGTSGKTVEVKAHGVAAS